MTDVFVSYSRKDIVFVRRMFDALTQTGRDAWVDWEGIPYSTEWWKEICAGIEEADNFLLVISPDALNSIYCHREIEYARKHSKRIILLLYKVVDEVALIGGWYTNAAFKQYEMLARENWETLRAIQWIDYCKLGDLEKTVTALLITVDTDPQRTKLHTRLLLRVRDWESRGRTPSALLRGDELAAYESWRDESLMVDNDPRPTGAQIAYIMESCRVENEMLFADDRRKRELREAMQSAEKSRQSLKRIARIVIPSIIIFVVLIIISGLVASTAQLQAYQANATVVAAGATLTPIFPTLTSVAEIITSQKLAAVANSISGNIQSFKLPGVLIGIRALKLRYTPEADFALSSALASAFPKKMFVGHAGSIVDVEFSANGLYLLSTTADGTAQLWNISEQKEIQRFAVTPYLITSAKFYHDNLSVLTASSDGIIRLWNIETGKEIREFKATALNGLKIATSHKGDIVFTGGIAENSLIQLWNVNTGEEISRIGPFESGVMSLAISPDDKTIVVGDGFHTASIWDIVSGHKLNSFDAASFISSVAVSSDGQTVVTATASGNTINVRASDIVQLWDISTGSERHRFIGHGGDITTALFSPDNQTILSTSADKTARLWDIQTGIELHRYVGNDSISSAAFSQDGKTIATGVGTSILLWDTDPGPEVVRFSGHRSQIIEVGFSQDGKMALTVSHEVSAAKYPQDNSVRFWDINTGVQLKQIDAGFDLQKAVLSPSGKMLVTITGESCILWNVETGEETVQFCRPNGSNPFIDIIDVAFSASGNAIITIDNNKLIEQWDFSGNITRQWNLPCDRIWLMPDGQVLTSDDQNKTVTLWAITSEGIKQIFKLNAIVIKQAFLASDDKTLLFVNMDNTISLWDTATTSEISNYHSHIDSAISFAFAPDGKTFLTVGSDDTISLWDTSTGLEVRRIAASGAIESVSFSPNGKTFLTGGQDGIARLWNTTYGDFISLACSYVYRDLNQIEQNQFGIDASSPTCPKY